LPKTEATRLSFRSDSSFRFLTLLILSLLPASGWSQTAPAKDFYARANTFGIFTAYSNNSSHILLGNAENRKLLNIGVAYNRRLLVNPIVNWQFSGEILPVALESDPLEHFVNQQTSPTVATYTGNLPYAEVTCAPVSYAYNETINNPNGGTITYAGTETVSCSGRQWTIGEALSPIGFQWNFQPRRKLQPFFVGHGGYMYSTKPIPIDSAGSFNFTFDLGAGIELYRTRSHSVRLEYRYHHISNHGTATQNPGIDNGLFQLTYTFGR
jgi:opacity protein-like surface antigen